MPAGFFGYLPFGESPKPGTRGKKRPPGANRVVLIMIVYQVYKMIYSVAVAPPLTCLSCCLITFCSRWLCLLIFLLFEFFMVFDSLDLEIVKGTYY